MEKVMEKAGNAFIGVSDRMKQDLLNEEIRDYIGYKDKLIYCGLYNPPKQQISIVPEKSGVEVKIRSKKRIGNLNKRIKKMEL